MSRRILKLIGAYAVLVVGCLSVEWWVTEGDEPALIASSPFVLLFASTLGAAIVWGRWRAVWLLPTVAVLLTALFLLFMSGSWWLRDSGDRAQSAFLLSLAWMFIAPFALAGVTFRHIPRWWSKVAGRS